MKLKFLYDRLIMKLKVFHVLDYKLNLEIKLKKIKN